MGRRILERRDTSGLLKRGDHRDLGIEAATTHAKVSGDDRGPSRRVDEPRGGDRPHPIRQLDVDLPVTRVPR